MADDRRRRTIRTELFTRESAAEHGRHPKDGKQIVEEERREHALRHVASRDVAIAQVERPDVREAAVRSDVDVFRRRQRLDEGRLRGQLWKRHPDSDETIGVGILKRAEDEPVEHAVDQAVPADRERQREHRDRGEAWPPHELPERETQILEERGHH